MPAGLEKDMRICGASLIIIRGLFEVVLSRMNNKDNPE